MPGLTVQKIMDAPGILRRWSNDSQIHMERREHQNIRCRILAERQGKYMSRKITYKDEPIGEVKIVKDFLPSPEELVFREDSVKVTISLSRKSVDFFKTEADRHHTQYQRMIRNLLDAYVDTQKPLRRTTRKRAAA